MTDTAKRGDIALADLIERLEKADGPSALLDADIHNAVGRKAFNEDVPRYTVSGPHSTQGGRYGSGNKRFDATLMSLSNSEKCYGATPAIALLIAILRALKARGGGQ